MNKYSRLFLEESRRYLADIRRDLDAPDRPPPETCADMSRLAHSIKGMAGFEGLPGIVSIAYALEQGLAALGRGDHDDGLAVHLLEATALCSRMLDEFEAAGACRSDPSLLAGRIRLRIKDQAPTG